MAYVVLEKHQNRPLPFSRALIWILLTTIVISGTMIMGYLYYCYTIEERTRDPSYHIRSIELRSTSSTFVSVDFIAEILGISLERPINSYKYSPTEGKQRLLSTHLFSHCEVSRKLPDALMVEYTLRTPIAMLADSPNTLMDGEGVAFSRFPLYPEVDLPQIFLGTTGEQGVSWGDRVTGKTFQLIKELFLFLENLSIIKVVRVDLSNSYAQSYGSRKIVFTVVFNEFEHTLYCSTRNYKDELRQYLALRRQIDLQDSTIDLRIPSLAFICY